MSEIIVYLCWNFLPVI